jgi:phosphoglycolate phosphatase
MYSNEGCCPRRDSFVPSYCDAMLIFFDIDATLITTSRSGMAALGDAGRELFGAGFEIGRTEFAGRLDPVIIADLLRDNAQEVSPDNVTAMRDGYRRHLQQRLKDPALSQPLPGVMPLLERLEAQAGVVLGLLTGNFPDTGAIKLRACGIEPTRFAIHVWGDCTQVHPPCRTHLPAIGIERYRVRFGEIGPEHVTIIGDTPHDIACARANGCRSLGVATGMHSVEQLRDAGADQTACDLSDTAAVLTWLLNGSALPRSGRQ